MTSYAEGDHLLLHSERRVDAIVLDALLLLDGDASARQLVGLGYSCVVVDLLVVGFCCTDSQAGGRVDGRAKEWTLVQHTGTMLFD